MISLPELHAKALRQYPDVLRAHLTGAELFPLPLRANKVLDRTRGAEHIHAQQAELLAQSKLRLGHGYSLTIRPNKKTNQSEISAIHFDTLADFLGFTGRQVEFDAFAANAARTAATLPALLPLLQTTPKLLLDHAADWPGLLTVCAFFKQNPQPNEYVRNLPLDLPTKFVEQHQKPLRSMLEALIPDHFRPNETDFFRRFHLLQEEPSIRIRFLDPAQRLHPAVSQCSVWVSEFGQLRLPVGRVFIIENLTSFLAFPPVPDALAIWGGGFAVSLLAGADWLAAKQMFYWGDLDVHGFQILARLRAHYPAAQSLLMDEATFRRYHSSGRGGSFVSQALPSLMASEQALYQQLLATNARLEQEQLPTGYVAAEIERIIQVTAHT